MAHPLELAEPSVIDEELIRNCITTVEEMSIPEDKKKELKTETELHDIKALSFSFQNILKIDNLDGLFSLVKLQLDNNIIEKIENIGHLTNLEWLDLSFNNIQHIEGLETLVKLTDLSLFNNQIDKLQNLDALTALNCLSIGHNHINDVGQAISYLRPFRNLKMLNMQGNPCSRDPEYLARIMAHLRDIVYVDYRLVDSEKVNQAKEQYQDELFDLTEEETKKDEEANKAREQADRLEQLREANLEGIDTLLNDMLNEEADAEQKKLEKLSFWLELIDEIQLEFRQLSTEFIDNTLNSNGSKMTEKTRFEMSMKESRAKIDADSIALVRKFESKKKKLLRQLEDMREDEAIKQLKELQDANEELHDDLLELELRQMEGDDQIISEFERRFGDLVNVFIEAAQNSFFAKVRDMENLFYQKALQMAQEELEHFVAGQLEEVSEEAAIFLSDKDIVLASLNASHDVHLSIIDTCEDSIVSREKKNYQSLVNEAKEESARRDRRRITEIGTVFSKNQKEIEELIINEQDR
mmetsp:Transcript_40907/g.83700  ORF Transcript_40907/g.83700 Transcript_40907/m.83700 type:complete len:526 (-) Transcript_40907:117-1694(-)